MILLFRDDNSNYWVKNTVVDCGKNTEPTNILNIELPNDISLEEFEEFEQVINLDVEKTNNKKLNNKLKHNKHQGYNEPKYQKVYIRGNSETINGNSRKKDSGYEFGRSKYKYKDSNFGINDLQKTPKHKHLYQYSRSDNNKGKVRNVSKNGILYDS